MKIRFGQTVSFKGSSGNYASVFSVVLEVMNLNSGLSRKGHASHQEMTKHEQKKKKNRKAEKISHQISINNDMHIQKGKKW